MLYRNILRRVPKEIFSIIFELGVDQGCIDFLSSICLTCRSWYSLAVSLPSLWRFIYVQQYTPLTKIALWIERSRSQPLSISIVVPDIHSYTPVDIPPQHSGLIAALLLGEFQRWQTVFIDSACDTFDFGDELTEITTGKNAVLLESLDLKLSGLRFPLPLTCIYPRLRSLTLDRKGCRWAEAFMEKAAETLTSLTIANVELSDPLTIAQLHNGLRHCQNLEEMRMDEIYWDVGEQQSEDNMITLPHLRILTLTSLSNLESFIRLLRLPKLVSLIAGDIEELASLFTHLAQHTMTVQNLTTGLWDQSSAMQSQTALLSFLARQRDLRSLLVYDARIDDEFVDRLIPSQENSIAPQLEKLGVPTENVSDSKLLSMVQSRHSAWLMEGPVKRLKHLGISGRELSDTVIQNLRLYVDIVEVHDLVDENDEL